NEKIIAIPSPHLTHRYKKIHNYTNIPKITLKQITHFFKHYKNLETSK
ncbi:inorganic pyrophosphatase, partial [Bacillus subtilis]